MTAPHRPGTPHPANPQQNRPGRNNLRLLAHQVRYEQLSFWRNPQAAFFTFALPIIIFVIFGAVFNSKKGQSFYFGLTSLQYYVPTIAAFSVLTACYANLANTLALRRHEGILKRLRGTPLPAWTYFSGLLANCIVVSIVDVGLIVILGALYGVPMPTHWGAIIVTMVAGAASFCALGVAVASVARNADAAPALVQFILFPLVFISGTYFPIHSSVLNHISSVFPVRPFNQALIGPFAQHRGFDWPHLAVLAAWGVGAGLVAVRRFRWDPRPE